MNTANLQLEGLYVAVTALAEALREKGLLSAAEIDRSLERAETVAWRAAEEKDVSAANIEAIIFPVRYLRVAVDASARGQHLPFHEVARIVGETKEPRPPGLGNRRREAQKLSEGETLTLATLQEAERDA